MNNQGRKSRKVEDQTGGVSSIQKKFIKTEKGKQKGGISHETIQENFSQWGGIRAQLVPSTVDQSSPALWHRVMIFQNTEKILQTIQRMGSNWGRQLQRGAQSTGIRMASDFPKFKEEHNSTKPLKI